MLIYYTGMYQLFSDVLKSILIQNYVSCFWIGDIIFYQNLEKATKKIKKKLNMKKMLSYRKLTWYVCILDKINKRQLTQDFGQMILHKN